MKYLYNGATVMRGPANLSLEELANELNIPLAELSTEPETEKEHAEHRSKQKLTGIEFESVMCSATSEDQHGLSGIWMQFALAQMSGETMPPVNFHFENGTHLVLNTENLDTFKAAWLPFRMSFFPMPEE